MKKNKQLKTKKIDTRQSINLKSQFKKIETGVKNGVFIFSAPLTIEQFASKINVPVSNILKKFLLMGEMKNLNSVLSEDEIGELCLEYNYDFKKETAINETNVLSNLNVQDDPKSLKPRPAIVTVMGHVDHGKTTLLDYIRKTHVAKGEAGGITQSIGAYQIEYNHQKITFIDTPGHAAFTEMRARGANVTDIVVLVVAIDDGIKPQTLEAIDHARAADVPIIVFVNKADKPNTNPDHVLSQLSEHDLLPEEWGGTTITIKGSALVGTNVDQLLEAILTVAEVNEYKANPNRLALGVVIESNLDRGLGPVATIIVQNGTLAKGDMMIAGSSYGKIRAMFDENGHELKIAGPSTPVKVTGLNTVPLAGDHFVVSDNEKDIKDIAEKIRLHQIQQRYTETELLTSDAKTGDKKLNVTLKTGANGSLEAIRNLLAKFDIPGVKLTLLRSAVGTISESDVELAKASHGIIIGFNVKPTKNVKDLALNQQVHIYFYDIIYRLSEEIEKLMKGKLDPVYVEEDTGEATIKQIWKHSKIGTIIGCLVDNGEISRNDSVRVLRDGVVIAKTEIASLRHVKEDVTKMSAGKECGITLKNFNDLKVGDIIQCYKVIEKK